MKMQQSDLKKEIKKYKAGYNILIEYFDSIDKDERDKVNKKLNKIGL